MNWPRAAGIITRKEIVESLRDRKTLLLMIVLPVVLYPLLFVGMSKVAIVQQERIAARQVIVAVTGGPVPDDLRAALLEDDTIHLEPLEDATDALTSGRVQVAISVPPKASEILKADEQVVVKVFFDGGDDLSRDAEQRVTQALGIWSDRLLATRLERVDLPRAFAEPVDVISNNVAPPARQGGWLLGQFLPMLVSVMMIGSAFYPAVDLTAGEKERGTLQTLLTAPVPSVAIVVGKFGAVVGLTLLHGLVHLGSVGLLAALMPLPEELSADIAFTISPGAVVLLLACMVALGALFGAFMMAVAVTAGSFKDAQSYLSPVYLVCLFPLMLTAIPGVELTPWLSAAPLINLALAMKAILLGEATAASLFIVFLSSLVWTALGLALAARVFAMEGVLLGDLGVRALFHRRAPGVARPDVPSVGEAVVLLGVVLGLMFYGSLLLKDQPLGLLIHVTQWGFLLLPTLVLVLGLRLDPMRTFSLRRPPLWALGSAIAIGSGLWYGVLRVAEQAMERWLPVPAPEFEALSEAFEAMAHTPGGVLVLFTGAALAPALCEELLFRGVLLQALRRVMQPTTAILVSAAVFSVFHLNLYQVPTTFVIGLILAALVLASGSLWPAVLLHGLHNALALGSQLFVEPETLHDPMGWTLLLLPVVGLVLLARRRGGFLETNRLHP